MVWGGVQKNLSYSESPHIMSINALETFPLELLSPLYSLASVLAAVIEGLMRKKAETSVLLRNRFLKKCIDFTQFFYIITALHVKGGYREETEQKSWWLGKYVS